MSDHAAIRSMLSVPGIRERFIDKAEQVRADAVLFDLEDSVAAADKAAARALVAARLPAFPKRGGCCTYARTRWTPACWNSTWTR